MALTSRYLPTVDFADPHEEMSILDTARRFVVSRDYHPGIKRIFHRVLVPSGDAFKFSPPCGWKIESIGPSFDPALPDAVSMTIWHPMPRVPTPRSILGLASDFMGHGRGQITLSWDFRFIGNAGRVNYLMDRPWIGVEVLGQSAHRNAMGPVWLLGRVLKAKGNEVINGRSAFNWDPLHRGLR